MKLLVVEDELSLQTALKKGFIKLGYVVETASDGEEALELYFSAFYDVIILDLNLPKIDGLEILRTIRNDNQLMKIIILSARSEVEDKIIGLDFGANDYLAKPFSFKELDARVRALIRRDFTSINKEIKIHNFILDTAKKKLLYLENEIILTKKQFAILEYLFINKGKIVSGEELIEHVWESDANAFTNAFKVHINALRKKLPYDVIKNVRGQGYYVE